MGSKQKNTVKSSHTGQNVFLIILVSIMIFPEKNPRLYGTHKRKSLFSEMGMERISLSSRRNARYEKDMEKRHGVLKKMSNIIFLQFTECLTSSASLWANKRLENLLNSSGYNIIKIAITNSTLSEGEFRPADPISCLFREEYGKEKRGEIKEDIIKELVPMYIQNGKLDDFSKATIERALESAMACVLQIPVFKLEELLREANPEIREECIPVRLHTAFGIFPPLDLKVKHDSKQLDFLIQEDGVVKNMVQSGWNLMDMEDILRAKLFLKDTSVYWSDYGKDALALCDMMRKGKTCCIVCAKDNSDMSRLVFDEFMTDFNVSLLSRRLTSSDPEQKITVLFDEEGYINDFRISNLYQTMILARAYKLEISPILDSNCKRKEKSNSNLNDIENGTIRTLLEWKMEYICTGSKKNFRR